MEEDQIGELYALPLDEFTSARNELVKKLRAHGEKKRADGVAKLKKPTVDAWALNQLPRRFPAEIDELATVTERVASAGAADEVRKLSQRRHELVARLVKSARKLLSEAGHGGGSETEHRIAQALYAATTSPDLDALRRGTFTRPAEGSSFESGELAVPAAAPTRRSESPARKARTEAKKRLQGALQEAERLRRTADSARRAAEVAEEEAAVAQREVMRLQRRLERLEDEPG